MASGNLFDCTLIENTSVINPTIRLKAPDALIGIETVTLSNQNHIQIMDGAGGLACPEVLCSIIPSQSGSGTPSPSNVRPITGFTEARIVQTAGAEVVNYRSALGRTVYGGTIDFVRGLITINAVCILGSTLSFTKHATYPYIFSCDIISNIETAPTANDRNKNIMCSQYHPSSQSGINAAMDNLGFLKVTSGANTRFFFRNDDYTNLTADDFEASMENVQIWYTLAEPTTFSIFPQVITTFQGLNNLDVNTGSFLTFSYKRYVSTPASKIYNLNYAYIDELQRYYWIRDIRYELGTWVFDLDIDVLASWKTKIGQSSEYVLRSASEKDSNVIDNLYPTKSYIEGDEQKATFTIFSTSSILTPSYVLSVVGPNHVADGVDSSASMLASTTYYVLQQSDLDLLCFAMMDNIDWVDIDPNEISYALQKQLINPYQYLVDCKLLPWKPDTVRTTGGTALAVTDIPLGFNSLEVASPGWEIARLPVIGGLSSSAAGLIKHFSNTFYIDLNPDTGTIGPWVNHAPYTMMDIYVEPFGRIPIPDWVLMLRSKDIVTHLSALPVVFDTWCDAIAGTVRLELSTYTLVPAGSVPEKITFFAATTKTGSAIPLYRTQQNITGAVEAFTSSAQAINPANPIGGTIAAAGNIMDGFSKLMPELQGSGTMGGLMDCLSDLSTPRVYKKFAKFVEFNNADNGSPLCKVKTLNTLSGFIQCQDSHFASEATAAENEAIINYLNGGFFYE